MYAQTIENIVSMICITVILIGPLVILGWVCKPRKGE